MIGLSQQAEASRHFDKQALLDKIKVPMLAIYGEDDVIARLRTVRILDEKVENIQVEILERCGHMPPYEKPKELAALICK